MMRNKFFFGAVVGFFVACVVFVVFWFFSVTVRAAVVVPPHTLAVAEDNRVVARNIVTKGVGLIEGMVVLDDNVPVGVTVGNLVEVVKT